MPRVNANSCFSAGTTKENKHRAGLQSVSCQYWNIKHLIGKTLFMWQRNILMYTIASCIQISKQVFIMNWYHFNYCLKEVCLNLYIKLKQMVFYLFLYLLLDYNKLTLTNQESKFYFHLLLLLSLLLKPY